MMGFEPTSLHGNAIASRSTRANIFLGHDDKMSSNSTRYPTITPQTVELK